MLDKKGQQKYRKILFKRIQEIGNRDLLEIFFSNLNKLFSDNNITEDLNETLNTAGLLQGNLQQ